MAPHAPEELTETWRYLVELLSMQRERFMTTAATLGLTPAHAGALRLLGQLDACPMRLLAEGLRCDASNVTAIVDRLEERGLVERRSDGRDRRVKLVIVTEAGRQAQAHLEAALFEPPPALGVLDDDERAQLARLVAKVRGALDAAG